jgi:hypothetical protein
MDGLADPPAGFFACGKPESVLAPPAEAWQLGKIATRQDCH